MNKRIISLLTAAVMLISVFAVTSVGAARQEPALGDVDGEDGVTILDATAIQRHLAAIISLDEAAVSRGMVTGGEELTILDATAIQRYLAGIIKVFPAQGDEPTQEPTDAPTEPPTEDVTEQQTQPQDEVTKVKNNITVFFSNNKKWTAVNAYIYNNATGTPMTAWPGAAMKLLTTNDYGEQIYSVTVDASQYDRIIFNNGTDQTTDTPLTKASTGYFINSKRANYNNKFLAGVYPYGQTAEGKIDTVTMDYPDGYKKCVYIWTPEGYDPADKTKKYHVLYMCDGQNLFGQATTLSGYEWECDETVLSMMQNGGDGVIVVGVDNSTNKRDHELTPNLGEIRQIAGENMSSFVNGGGAVYSDFVVDTVIPYVEANYNVSTVRGVAGSSSGGIEAFYIGMEHRDKFRFIGALSPAFLLYSKATWDSYLSEMDFSEDAPRIYFYSGNSSADQLEQAIYPDSVAMEGWLKAKGYPSEKMLTVTDGDATHSEGFWALYFPEMLSFGLDL